MHPAQNWKGKQLWFSSKSWFVGPRHRFWQDFPKMSNKCRMKCRKVIRNWQSSYKTGWLSTHKEHNLATEPLEGFPGLKPLKTWPKYGFWGLGGCGGSPTLGPIACLGPISLLPSHRLGRPLCYGLRPGYGTVALGDPVVFSSRVSLSELSTPVWVKIIASRYVALGRGDGDIQVSFDYRSILWLY